MVYTNKPTSKDIIKYSNLRKSIHYLQQHIRGKQEHDESSVKLYMSLDLLMEALGQEIIDDKLK